LLPLNLEEGVLLPVKNGTNHDEEVNPLAKKEQEPISTDDAVLLMLLSLVEEDGIEVEISIVVNGTIISGTLIGASAYYEGVTESSKQLQDTTMSKFLSKKFNSLKEAYAKQKQEDSENEEKEFTPTFIHLKHATYLSAAAERTYSNSTWWRGKISSVDGFSFDFSTRQT
jgi:hypothetical protein